MVHYRSSDDLQENLVWSVMPNELMSKISTIGIMPKYWRGECDIWSHRERKVAVDVADRVLGNQTPSTMLDNTLFGGEGCASLHDRTLLFLVHLR